MHQNKKGTKQKFFQIYKYHDKRSKISLTLAQTFFYFRTLKQQPKIYKLGVPQKLELTMNQEATTVFFSISTPERPCPDVSSP
jgi:hypothetical protein